MSNLHVVTNEVENALQDCRDAWAWIGAKILQFETTEHPYDVARDLERKAVSLSAAFDQLALQIERREGHEPGGL